MSKPKLHAVPEWFDGKRINEVLFSQDFLDRYPMKCINGQLFTEDGAVEDEEWVKQLILNEIRDCITTGLHKRVSNLLEVVKLQAYSQPLPMETDRIHVGNGVYFLDGRFIKEKEFCLNRLPVKYENRISRPEKWLHFLSELLEEDDIPTLQEYMGYCLIPSNKAQKLLLMLGKGGEGKSRIVLVMRSLLGVNMNMSSIQKVEHNRFARADLEHRLLMVDDDMKMEALKEEVTGLV